ncbi:E3 ubiquitin-protein ligase TRIM56-like [Patiria miniata]|uniref:Tripartite motif-containing protein 3-like n=1 Tax=Patiria miniata TaxID=46514 RepID=A0A914AEN7_PATMI|nr:E3 ubiquitin-protein ligase TRIM56-like [Patiria miniata]
MATALKKITTHLECDICQEKYKRPKVLDCQHSFCKTCLEKYYTSRYAGQPNIPCPVCRRETILPETRIQGLKTNFHLMGIVEEVSLQEKVASSENTKVICELCDEGNEAMHRCLDCAQNICPNCCKTHLRCTATSNHTVATLEDIRQGKVTVKKAPEEDESKCQIHKGEVKRFYCETCEELICRDCTVVDHREPKHHYIDSGEASRKYKQSLKDMFPNVTTGIKILQKALATSSQAKQKFTQNVTKTVKAVKDKADKMRAEITTQETKLIEEIKQLQQDRNKTYDKHQATVTMMLKSKQFSFSTAQDVIDTASDTDLLSLYPIISKDLKSLKSQNPPQIDPKPSYLSFTLGQRIGDINLGKLEVETGKWEMCCEIGKEGSGPGEFSGAVGVTATQPGEIAVADYGNNRVVICSNEGQHKGTIPLQHPQAVAAIHNPEQRLLVLERGSKYVKVFNMKDNTLVRQFPTMPKHQVPVEMTKMNLSSLAVTKNSILVGDIDNLVWTEHKPTNGEILHTIPVQTPPHYLAVDDDTDRVVVSGWNTKKVDIADSKGKTHATIQPTINGKPVGYCNGVCCDSSGIYLVVYQGVPGTGHIHHYDLDGRFLDCLAQGLCAPCGITITSGGQLAVADHYSIKMFHKV